jgi:hypothetical protein
MQELNQIVLSTNEDPIYCEFWKPMAWAYSQMFKNDGVTVHLAFLTNRSEDDPLVQDYRKYGKVTLFRPIAGLPEFGQAKMIRFILAAQQQSDVCYVDDIDLFPLSKEFIMSKLRKRPKDTLLCVGGEVYRNNGCYPVSQMTAEGYIWNKFINPNNLSYEDYMKSLIRPHMYDRREDIRLLPDFAKDLYFSDERLIRRLTTDHPVQKFEHVRGYDNYLESTVDRINGVIDINKLKQHKYVNGHFNRPYSRSKAEYRLLLDYIQDTYGGKYED